ncbi:helix-turn-helix domain-containing protein [Pseudonocardia sp. TRM90224]|uniref:helix-turn-helix domain-containing protein n=1 Tax=Pseudonocardia sp. TRM90224 TaxID=2812678 RepID=UPI001E632A69|nr:helix-turn-helix transcriptional regulator [Pseudonocardia sp. TRM90224]
MSAGTPNEATQPTFAELLNRLFVTVHPIGGKPLSLREASKRARELGGSLSHSYIGELRSGAKDRPSQENADLLAQVFGVRPGYFNDPGVRARVDRDLDRLAARHRDHNLIELAQRTASLDDVDRAALADLVQNYLRKRRTGSDERRPS